MPQHLVVVNQALALLLCIFSGPLLVVLLKEEYDPWNLRSVSLRNSDLSDLSFLEANTVPILKPVPFDVSYPRLHLNHCLYDISKT